MLKSKTREQTSFCTQQQDNKSSVSFPAKDKERKRERVEQRVCVSMDVYEATRIVLSKIQSLDPTNASKIMGLLLLQDHEEKEMIRLAFGPQNLLHSVIAKAKTELGLLASTLDRDFELEDRLSFLESDLGFGCGQCSYLCNCKFVHAGVDGSRIECNELLRSKSVPPKLAHQFTGGSPFQFSPKGVNLLQGEAQRLELLSFTLFFFYKDLKFWWVGETELLL